MNWNRRFKKNSSSAPNKYRNKKLTVDGVEYDSKGEYERWIFLRQREREGVIHDLQRQVKIELIPAAYYKEVKQLKTKTKYVDKVLFSSVNYFADFVYYIGEDMFIEDYKGLILKEFKDKMKYIYYKYNVLVRVVKNPLEPILQKDQLLNNWLRQEAARVEANKIKKEKLKKKEQIKKIIIKKI